ncbi:MAG: hypothetical protein CEN91_448 [Candidatus Berkelbacteria bacterium Licking1014_85]|uniref:Uncharacterized protein n=1 Tax=Candidatus Berkelbacteria bacterium Licking1014_85 TaxID=2017148 RepID=A0A554LHU9_9BACT|nr:MAG: hypothetical protein CEN91_448 [Candidatus Berkelbacteria bacterium Licking1014_85]
MEDQNNAKPKSILKKKFISWKVYALIAVIFWLSSVLMAGSIVGDIIIAVYAIPALLAIIYILGGIFGKKDRDVLIKRGKESLVAGVGLELLYSFVYGNISSNNSAIAKSIYAMNGITEIMLLALIISGIICLIRGYILPKESHGIS